MTHPSKFNARTKTSFIPRKFSVRLLPKHGALLMVCLWFFSACGNLLGDVSDDGLTGGAPAGGENGSSVGAQQFPADDPHQVTAATYNPACHGSTGENPMPDGYCDPDIDIEANERAKAAKMAALRDIPSGEGWISKALAIRLKNFPLVNQVCTNYCGPAATQGVLAYYGIDQSQQEIAEAEGTGACNVGAGTCVSKIRDYLDSAIKNKVFIGDSIGAPSANEDRQERRLANAQQLISWVVRDVEDYNQPVIVLINQTPIELKYHFPGFIGDDSPKDIGYNPKRAHYVTLIGYKGTYTGEDHSAEFIFRESSGRNQDNEEVDVNAVVAELESNDGFGGCTGNDKWNVIW